MIADNINKVCNNKYSYVFSRRVSSNKFENSSTSNASNTFINKDSSDLKKSNNHSKSYNEIGFSSIRGGTLVGEHTVLFICENESFELTHVAYSRNIYIEGALKAAEFIVTKRNGLYGMANLL